MLSSRLLITACEYRFIAFALHFEKVENKANNVQEAFCAPFCKDTGKEACIIKVPIIIAWTEHFYYSYIHTYVSTFIHLYILTYKAITHNLQFWAKIKKKSYSPKTSFPYLKWDFPESALQGLFNLMGCVLWDGWRLDNTAPYNTNKSFLFVILQLWSRHNQTLL